MIHWSVPIKITGETAHVHLKCKLSWAENLSLFSFSFSLYEQYLIQWGPDLCLGSLSTIMIQMMIVPSYCNTCVEC